MRYFTLDLCDPSSIYIKKELSRMVVCELLPRATAHEHQTFPDYGRHTRSRSKGGDVREEAPAEECAAKKPPNNRPPSWIYGENIRFSAHAPMLPIQKNPNRCSRTPPANIDEKRPNVPSRRTLYLTSI